MQRHRALAICSSGLGTKQCVFQRFEGKFGLEKLDFDSFMISARKVNQQEYIISACLLVNPKSARGLNGTKEIRSSLLFKKETESKS